MSGFLKLGILTKELLENLKNVADLLECLTFVIFFSVFHIDVVVAFSIQWQKRTARFIQCWMLRHWHQYLGDKYLSI